MRDADVHEPGASPGDELDARTDLYSLGVLLYQLATGSLPFESDTPVGFPTAHLSKEPVPPRLRRPDLSITPALDALISRALMKEPGRRFQSAEQMRSALFACLPKAAEGSKVSKEVPRGPAGGRRGRAAGLSGPSWRSWGWRSSSAVRWS